MLLRTIALGQICLWPWNGRIPLSAWCRGVARGSSLTGSLLVFHRIQNCQGNPPTAKIWSNNLAVGHADCSFMFFYLRADLPLEIVPELIMVNMRGYRLIKHRFTQNLLVDEWIIILLDEFSCFAGTWPIQFLGLCWCHFTVRRLESQVLWEATGHSKCMKRSPQS